MSGTHCSLNCTPRGVMRCLLSFATIILTPAVVATADEDEPVPTGRQTAMRFETDAADVAEMDYWLYLPEGYETKGEQWPLLIFLHGAGERGEDVEKVKVHGPPKIVESKPDFPFVVVSPQSRKFGWDVELLDSLLDDVISKRNVDPDRVYLTGLSMGGYGTWALASAQPERFAAIVPICGGGKPDQADRLAGIPTWVFHGAKDKVVPIEQSQRMVDAVKAAGGDVQFTVYPEAGHDSWTATYDNPELYEWLLAQKRKARE